MYLLTHLLYNSDANIKFRKISEAYKRLTDPDSFKDEDDEGDFAMDESDVMAMFMEMFMGGGMNCSPMITHAYLCLLMLTHAYSLTRYGRNGICI